MGLVFIGKNFREEIALQHNKQHEALSLSDSSVTFQVVSRKVPLFCTLEIVFYYSVASVCSAGGDSLLVLNILSVK